MSYMQTFSGRKFYPNFVEKTDFVIEDIAHALSNLCRFGGHVRKFYSVAQHSVIVSDILQALGEPTDVQLWGLMHDATEAYLVDIPTPIKGNILGYKELEAEVMQEIARVFDLKGQCPEVVHLADQIALATEASQLITGDVGEWPVFKKYNAAPILINPLSPDDAKTEFLGRYDKLSTFGEKCELCNGKKVDSTSLYRCFRCQKVSGEATK